jgi:hypothetical protein
MSAINVTIHSTGSGACSLTGRDGDGLTVTFEDGTVRESFLSWRAFRQLLGMKAMQGAKPEPRLAPKSEPKPAPIASALPLGNGAK